MAELVGDTLPIPKAIAILSTILERTTEHNDAEVAGAKQQKMSLATAFCSQSKPLISIRSYLERIFRYANCSTSFYVVAYIYLDRFFESHPSAAIDSYNVHRFLIVSVLAAIKFMDDIHYNNYYFAKVGGISLMEMNYLEVDFLFGVRFELDVTPVLFASYCSILQREMYMESAPMLSRFIYSSSEEESNKCQQSYRSNWL